MILCSVELEETPDGFLTLKCDSAGKLTKAWYTDIVRSSDEAKGEVEKINEVLEGDIYDCEIIEKKICPKTHTKKFLVRWIGYTEDENEWIDEADFAGDITHTSKGRSGRTQYYKMKSSLSRPSLKEEGRYD